MAEKGCTSTRDLMQLTRSTKYPLDAFLFVQRGLEYTVRRMHGELDLAADPASRHVSGRDLCHGLRDFALQEYGLMARVVLRHWHITRSEDFGNIVFVMIDAGLMQKTDDDSIHDFVSVYDFSDAFSASLTLPEK